jgi:hypothetical protein
MSLPPADRQYLGDLDRAYAVFTRAMLGAMRAYDAENDLREAMDAYNALAGPAHTVLSSAVTAAQVALQRRAVPIGTCETCGGAMTIVEDGQRYHPNCAPPSWMGAPSSAPVHPPVASGDDEEW